MKLYYIQDTRTICGNCVVWWRANGEGYTCDLNDAGLYTQEEVDHLHRKTDVPRDKDFVESLAPVKHILASKLKTL